MKSILIVEDDLRLQRFYKSYIETTFEGLRIFQAFDGEEALSSCNSINHTMILTDIEMPNIDGIQFYKILKNQNIELSERVAFVSGSISGKNLTFIRQEKRPHLLKPHSLDHLRDLINSIISREEGKFISRYGHECKRKFTRKKIKEECRLSMVSYSLLFKEPLITETLDYSEGGISINFNGHPLPLGEQCIVDIKALDISEKAAIVAWADNSENISKAGLMWV
ncbi:MAG: response regulator [bacterium]|nr:response regulator [bacterium]